MGDTPKMSELPGLIDKGLAMVEERLRDSGGARIYASIKAQLTYMKQTIDAAAKPTDEQLDKVLLGVYAAREFETSDPDFADVQFNVEYLFKRL
jgi:Tsi6